MPDTTAFLQGIVPQLIESEPRSRIGRACVTALHPDGSVETREADDDTGRLCDVLHTGAAQLLLAPGDTVLVWHPEDDADRGIVLGRIGAASAAHTVPDELLIEAGSTLKLRCGDGSLTIREDGRILLKGRDVVSHATRTNRVRGGAVAIN